MEPRGTTRGGSGKEGGVGGRQSEVACERARERAFPGRPLIAMPMSFLFNSINNVKSVDEMHTHWGREVGMEYGTRVKGQPASSVFL